MNLTGVHLDNLNIAFHKAVEAQDYAKILFLFAAGADVNSQVHGGKSMPESFESGGGMFAPRWCHACLSHTEYVWSPDDSWEEDTRTQEDFRQGVAISGGGLAQGERMGITALMRAAAVEHACGKNDENDEEGDKEGDEGEEEGDDDDAVFRPGTWQYKRWLRPCRRHPRHWVIRLLLNLGADPKIPGGTTCFREGILEFLSMHPSRLSGSSKYMFYVSSYYCVLQWLFGSSK